MELSRQLLSEIIGVDPDAAPAYGAQHERRRHGRVAFDSRAKIFPLLESAGGDGCAVLVRDISRAGMGFLLDEPMGIGDEFIIHLRRQNGEPIQIHSMVNRCEPGGTGRTQFLIGSTFELVLNSTEPLIMPSEESEENADGASTAGAVTTGGSQEGSQSAEDLFDQCIKGAPELEVAAGARNQERMRLLKPIRVPLAIIARGGHDIASLLRCLTAPATKLCRRLGAMIERHGGSSLRIRNRLRPTKMTKAKKTKTASSRAAQTQPEVAAMGSPGGPAVSSAIMPTESAIAAVSPANGPPASGDARKSLFAPAPQAAQQAAPAVPVEAPIAVTTSVPAIEPASAPPPALVIEMPVAVAAVNSIPVVSVSVVVPMPVAVVPVEEAPAPAPWPPESIQKEPVLMMPEIPAAVIPPARPAPAVEAPTPLPVPALPADLSAPEPEKRIAPKHVVSTGSRIGLHTAYARHPRRRSGR